MKRVPTALLAEDEPLLAQALRSELTTAWPELQIIATVADGTTAVERTLALKPDVLFFDVRMPGRSGLEAAADLADQWPAGEPFPALVFVTAYDQYAVQAFEAQAVDYVLKPVQPARLAKTVAKLRELLARRASAGAGADLQPTFERLRALLATAAPPPGAPEPLKLLQVSVGSSVRIVPLADIVCFEAADKYVRVLTAAHEYLIRTPLKELVPRLDPAQFWQVHRGTVVRAEAVESVTRDDAGRLHLRLRGRPERLSVSRLYAHLFKPL